MKRIMIGMAVLFCCLLTGCYDKVEIDDRSYVMAMGIDKEPGKEQVGLSLSAAKLVKGKGQGEEKQKDTPDYFTGKTLSDAMASADGAQSRRTYFGHTKAVIFGEALLKDKALFMEVLDGLKRNREISSKMVVLAVEGKAKDAIAALADTGEESGLYLWDFYKNNGEETAATTRLSFENLLIAAGKRGDGLLPLLQVTGEGGGFSFGGAALLSNGAVKGFLSPDEMESALLLCGLGKGAIITTRYDNAEASFQVVKNKAKRSFSEIEGKLYCTVEIEAEGILTGYQRNRDKALTEQNGLSGLQEALNRELAQSTENVLTLLKNVYKADSLGFTDDLEKWDNKLYQAHYAGGKELFTVMEVIVVPKIRITSIGME